MDLYKNYRTDKFWTCELRICFLNELNILGLTLFFGYSDGKHRLMSDGQASVVLFQRHS